MKLQSSLFAAGLILIFAGCGGNSPGVGVYSTSWSVNESGKIPVNGLEDAQVMIGKIGDDPVIVVWADCNGSFGGQATGSGKAFFDGTLRSDDGRELFIELKILPGQTGKVVIDGQLFDPAKGRFFLVSTVNLKTRVQQLDRMLPKSLLIEASEDKSAEFREFARADADIMAFYATVEPETHSAAESPSAAPATH